MKKVYIITLIFILGICNFASSQVKDNAVKINLFGAVVSQYQFSYERAINENFTAQISLGYINRIWKLTPSSSNYEGGYEIGTKGIIVIPEGRYYFSESMDGAYIAAFFRYRSVNQMIVDNIIDIDNDGNDYNWSYNRNKTSIGGGIVFGYQVLVSEAMIIDIFIGPQYKAVSKGNIVFEMSNMTSDDISITVKDKGDRDGIGIRFGINFGVAF